MLLAKEKIKQKPLLQGGKAFFTINKIFLLITVLLICFMPITLFAEENYLETELSFEEAIKVIAKENKNIEEADKKNQLYLKE